MPQKPSREYNVRLCQEKTRVDSDLRRLAHITGCPTYGFEGDAEAVAGAHAVHGADVVNRFGQRLQVRAFLLEQLHRPAARLPVHAHVGDLIQPLPGDGVELAEVGDPEPRQVLLGRLFH